MTRFARRGTQTTKKPHEASSWLELKKGWETYSKCHHDGHSPGECQKDVKGSPKGKASPCEGTRKEKNRLEVKRERRREEKRMKRMRLKERPKVCEFCQEIGHQTSECPCRISDASCFGACTLCGSSDHASDHCTGPTSGSCPTCDQPGHKEEDCPAASDEESDTAPEPCPICHELGHEVRGCPDNPRSIYPMGGCCRECGSVEHKSTHCTEKQQVKVEEVTLSTRRFGSQESADAYEEEPKNVTTVKTHRKKAKVVVF